MIERLVLVPIIFVIVWLLLRGFNQLSVFRRKQFALQLEGFELGSPAILYFSSMDCLPCQTVQRPVISTLKSELKKHLQVIEIDAIEHPELTSLWGVISLPTTYLLDSKGIPQRVNHGVVSAERLRKQLDSIR
jgi:thiol-disulfide isomerase/thioredoxin